MLKSEVVKGKFFIQTLGCRLNQAESQELEQLFFSKGWKKTSEMSSKRDSRFEADLVVINSCVITQKAEKEVRQAIYKVERENPKAKLIVAGCWVNKIRLFKEKPIDGIDSIIGNGGKWRKIYKILNIKYNLPANATHQALQAGKYKPSIKNILGTRSLIKIQSGCDNNCSFCIARLVRGKPKSATISQIVGKIKKAMSNNALEIILTGQNVSQYNDNDKSWIDLIAEVLAKTNVKLLRLGSINPRLVELSGSKKGKFDARPDKFSRSPSGAIRTRLPAGEAGLAERFLTGKSLIEIFNGAGKDRLARHLHLSLQSGSDRILKLMNRKYTTKDYYQTVGSLRREVEGLNITTDVIVGFPSETKEDFQKTLKFCRKVKFGKIHIFRYSDRLGTAALKLPNKVDEKTKIRRAKILAKLEKKLRLDFWQSQIGKTTMAIVWKNGRGLTDNYIPVKMLNVKGLSLPKIFKVKFSKMDPNYIQVV